ncbi:PX-associated-domain-containing protein [Apodospora peruviana]|uniref:PX-associated-domain-containing protein n=1 Tax=Apodospora peruviana TaxID=516989 RepID=A0AAE0M2F5_9PEZI|nr:PX-associated-domain-containing protein [Apodospora peruviana]
MGSIAAVEETEANASTAQPQLKVPQGPKRMSSNFDVNDNLRWQSGTVAPETLTSAQLHALFDILTHYETYAEVELFKYPDTLAGYGYPFTTHHHGDEGTPSYATESTAPLLAALLRSIVLPIPGIRDLPPQFWHVRFQGILTKLAEAELSESYDKAVLGTRKTLATAASAIHESVSRGILGGIPRGPKRNLNHIYDRSKASDLQRAWEDVVHELVYGELIEELFEWASTHQSLENHSRAVEAAMDYIIMHVATFLHHAFVLSSEGPYLLKLIENLHKMMPYSTIRQVLRIGNVATMINGMTKLLLAKMGIGSFSNWVGLTRNTDEGMNLLQWIISNILLADASDFWKTAYDIEKAKDGPPKVHLSTIKQYILNRSEETHEKARKISVQTPTSIIAAIIGEAAASSLSKAQHAQCLEYFSATLAERDRQEITKVLCRQNPDLFTQAIRDLVASFEPMIRTIHERVDLREHVSSLEGFLTDFINTSKPKKTATKLSNNTTDAASDDSQEDEAFKTRAPSIEDYVGLLRRNRQLAYNLMHDVASKCPEIRNQFRDYAKDAIKVFASGQKLVPPAAQENGRQRKSTSSESQSESFVSAIKELQIQQTNDSLADNTNTDTQDTKNDVVDGVVTSGPRRKGAAGALSSNFQSLFTALPSGTRANVVSVVDAHAAYLSALEDLSLQKMQNILDDLPVSSVTTQTQAQEELKGRNMCGPGMFLSRWQQLLDETVVTPEMAGGLPRRGKDVKHAMVQGKTVSAVAKDAWDPAALTELAERDVPVPPDADVVIRALGDAFRELVVNLGKMMDIA